MADPIVLQCLARELSQPFFVMASSHLFRGSKLLAWTLRKMGAFSVYREGVDRDAAFVQRENCGSPQARRSAHASAT